MRLRTALRMNAVFSLVSGVIAIAFAGPISDLFDIAPGWVLGVGAGLIPFALGIAALTRRDSIAPGAVMQIVVADLAWVLGAAAVIAIPGLIAPGGKVLLGILTLVVAVLAWAQWSAIGEGVPSER